MRRRQVGDEDWRSLQSGGKGDASLWECDLRSERDVACERCCDAGKGAGVGSVCLEGTGSDTKWAIGS